MMKRLAHITLLVLLTNSLSAQDPNFTQFFHNNLYYNPGMTAINGGLHLNANYRNLWGPIPSKFNTFSFAADAQAINKIGLGLIAVSDNEGEGNLRTNFVGFHYSYRPIETRNLRLQMGMSGSFVHKHVDFSQFVFSDQLDEVFGDVNPTSFVVPGNNQVMYPDFAAGAAVRYNNPNNRTSDYQAVTTIGFAFHHLTRPRDAFLSEQGRLPRKFVFHANTNIEWQNVIYAPGLIYERQSNIETFQFGMNIMKYPIFTGFWFRNRNYKFNFKSYDSFIFNLGAFLKVNDTRMKFTYSFDFTVSRLKTASMGSHEMSVIIHLKDAVVFYGLVKRSKRKFSSRFLECVDY